MDLLDKTDLRQVLKIFIDDISVFQAISIFCNHSLTTQNYKPRG